MHNWLFKILGNDERNRLDSGTKTLIVILFYVIVAVLVLMMVLLYVNYKGHVGGDKPYLGTFGDFFGGVLNPILTFGTLIGLSATVILQRISLRASKLQAFETTLFNMLALHNNIVQQLRFNKSMLGDRNRSFAAYKTTIEIGQIKYSPPEDVEGRSVFKAILLTLNNLAKTEQHALVKVYKEDLQDKHNYVLGHYFRNLYQILRLIDRNHGEILSTSQANEYTAIIRSQLSAHELALLFLNCQHEVVDSGKFQALLIKYEVLEHLPLRFDLATGTLDAMDFHVDEEFLRHYFARIRAPHNGIGVRFEVTSGAYGTNRAVAEYLSFLK